MIMKQPELGLKIVELRQSKGLTQEELVKQCNLSVRTLQRIESGDVVPRGYTLRLISKVLNFDFFSLAQNDSNQDQDKSKSLKSDAMSNLERTRELLIERYAYLSLTPVKKARTKLETNDIEDIIEKQNKQLAFTLFAVVLNLIALILVFIAFFTTGSLGFILITNVIGLLCFVALLQFNYEIRHILKALKEIG